MEILMYIMVKRFILDLIMYGMMNKYRFQTKGMIL